MSTAKSRLLPLVLSLLSTAAVASETETRSRGWNLSVETDPVFWVATIPNGPAFDLNVNLKLDSVPGLRVGVLGYSGVWAGAFSSVALPDAFREPDWSVRWSGGGLEAQYQFALGVSRGGLQPGLRLQWNRFEYRRGGERFGIADHLVVTPQVGFQWFPFDNIGVYVLPWAGVQVPVLGTRRVGTGDDARDSRKLMPVITAHVGVEF